MNGLMDGWMDGWIDGWMDGWMDEWMDGWMDGWHTGYLLGLGVVIPTYAPEVRATQCEQCQKNRPMIFFFFKSFSNQYNLILFI